MEIRDLQAKVRGLALTKGFAGSQKLALKMKFSVGLDVHDPFFLVLESIAPEFTSMVRNIIAARDSGKKLVQRDVLEVKFSSARLGGRSKQEITLWDVAPDGRGARTSAALHASTGAFSKWCRAIAHPIPESKDGKPPKDVGPPVTLEFDLLAAVSLLSVMLPQLDDLDGTEVYIDLFPHTPDVSEAPASKPKKKNVDRLKAAAGDADDDDDDSSDHGGRGLDGWAAAVAASKKVVDSPRTAESFLGLADGHLADVDALRAHLEGLPVKPKEGDPDFISLRSLYEKLYGSKTRMMKSMLVNAVCAALRARLTTGAPDGWPQSMPWGRWTAAAIDEHIEGLNDDDARSLYAEMTNPDAAESAAKSQLKQGLKAAFAHRFAEHFITG